MTHKPKIHVFLGTPAPPGLLPSALSEAEPGPWSTMELFWQRGRLRPRGNEAGGLGGDGCVGDEDMAHTSEHLRRVRQGPDTRRRPSPDRERGCGEMTQADPAHFMAPPYQDEQTTNDKEALCSESVREYLDSCFPGPDSNPNPNPSPERAHPRSDAALSVSVETEHLSAWTVSHALLLRGRLGVQPETSPERATQPPHSPPPTSTSSPELYSPVSPTPSPRDTGPGGTQQGSMELFYEPLQSQRQKEAGVILEATPDGMLCFHGDHREVGVVQGVSKGPPPTPTSPVHTSPISPAPKRSRVSPTLARTERPPSETKGRAWGATTLLARCDARGVRYSVLAAVVHPCHLKEIKVKRGASAGSSIPLASMVVTDQSGVEMKVVLWRKAAFWALTVYPGDVLLITGVMLNEDRWRGETVLQTSYSSRLLNLGQVTSSSCPPVPHSVSGRTLRSLCAHLCERRPLLVSLPPRVPQSTIPHCRLRTLKPDTLVHALLRVTHTEMITAWRAEAEGISRAGGVLKAVLTVEQGDGHQGAVMLWGAALAWLRRISRNRDALWEFRVLLVRENMSSGLLELHSTPWGSCEPLFPDDTRAQEFYRPGLSLARPSLEIDLPTLLSQKYTGEVELRVQISAFQFQGSPSQDALQLMDCETPLERILDTVSGDITFTGCGLCTAELDTDANGIYCPCYPCLPHTGVRRYYRPVVLNVKDQESQVCVQVPPVLLQKILLDTPPDKLNKTVAPGSEVRQAQVVADRIHTLLSLPRRTFHLTVRSHFLSDENSVTTVQDFLLLDFRSP